MFEALKMAYQMGWATETDLNTAVAKGLITTEQKTQIMAG